MAYSQIATSSVDFARFLRYPPFFPTPSGGTLGSKDRARLRQLWEGNRRGQGRHVAPDLFRCPSRCEAGRPLRRLLRDHAGARSRPPRSQAEGSSAEVTVRRGNPPHFHFARISILDAEARRAHVPRSPGAPGPEPSSAMTLPSRARLGARRRADSKVARSLHVSAAFAGGFRPTRALPCEAWG